MRIRKAATTVIMVCLAGIFLVSAWKLGTILRDYISNQKV